VKNKYGNKKTIVDGISFSSRKEGKRYSELKLLEKSGKIYDLKLQPKFLLQPKFEYRGKTHNAIYYKADFSYIETKQKDFLFPTMTVEDVKGWDKKKGEFISTKDYKIKKKLFLFQNANIDFREV
jgi:hypothetical protein